MAMTLAQFKAEENKLRATYKLIETFPHELAAFTEYARAFNRLNDQFKAEQAAAAK